MVTLIAKLLLIAMLGALSVVDRFTDQIYSRLDDRRTQAPPPPRVSRDTTATSDTHVNGFRTTHVVVPTPALTPYDPFIEQYSTQLAVSADLVRGVVQVESGFNPSARSSAGAMGLMQLMPETAAELGVTNPYDPSENLRGGITYLNQLLEQYDGNEEIALAAYNAGPAAVARYGNRVPPYQETRDYVRRVRTATATAARFSRPADDGSVYKSYAIVDGWWTVVPSNVPPESGQYAITESP